MHTILKVEKDLRTNLISDLECVQLSEPGRVTVICQIRVKLDKDMQPLCLFDEFAIDVPCKCVCILALSFSLQCHHAGDDINNIVIVPSEIPIISEFILPTNVSFLISTFDPMGVRIRMTLHIDLSKFNLCYSQVVAPY